MLLRWPSPETEKKQKSPEYAHLSFLKGHISEIIGLFAEPGKAVVVSYPTLHNPGELLAICTVFVLLVAELLSMRINQFFFATNTSFEFWMT